MKGLKTVTRRTVCVDCFGQGIAPYGADSTHTWQKYTSYIDYVAAEAFSWEDPVYVLNDRKKAFVRKCLCRTCGGTGYTDCLYPDVIDLLRNEGLFEQCVLNYVYFKNGHANEDSYKYYCDHFQHAASLLYEIPKLDAKINRMHRRAQQAEGKLERMERAYINACREITKLRRALKRAHGIDHPLRGGRPALTVRTKKKRS